MTRISFLLLGIILISSSVEAEEIHGHVVAVADGDTLTILVRGQDQIKVRLAEIDAPEKAQPFGQRSKQSLSELCFDKEAVLFTADTDRYGRTVARVHCAGVDANAEQIRVGLAWAYRKYLHDQSLLDLENAARTTKRGLWLDSQPIPPWEFRKQKRHTK
ncbi:MAG TPA: thermonuclease family protein [Gallionella sp.]|nr:thermonuclease family protein [Gallionella sp.]